MLTCELCDVMMFNLLASAEESAECAAEGAASLLVGVLV